MMVNQAQRQAWRVAQSLSLTSSVTTVAYDARAQPNIVSMSHRHEEEVDSMGTPQSTTRFMSD